MIRGCGKRKAGGVYVMSELGPDGVPLEAVMIDPPVPYDGGPFRAPQLVRKDGVAHLVFWVGAEFYEYPMRLPGGDAKARGVAKGACGFSPGGARPVPR